jgi:hypothetical protein
MKKKRGCLGTLFLIMILIIGGCSILDSCGADKITTTKKKTATPEYKRIANTLRNEYDFSDSKNTKMKNDDGSVIYSYQGSKYSCVLTVDKNKKIKEANFFTYNNDLGYLSRAAEVYSKDDTDAIGWVKATAPNVPGDQAPTKDFGNKSYELVKTSEGRISLMISLKK